MSDQPLLWTAVLVGAIGCYLLKVGGMVVPESVLEHTWVRRSAELVPVALLAALMAVQTFATGQVLVIDARVAGVAAGAVALLLRAPFIVIVLVAAVTAALVRLVF